MSKTLQKIRDVIVREYRPDKIILFGSRVWGKPRKDSDYDLFILKKGVKKRIHRRSGDVIRIKRKAQINIPIDAIVYNQKELNFIVKKNDQFYRDILSKGKMLYEKRG